MIDSSTQIRVAMLTQRDFLVFGQMVEHVQIYSRITDAVNQFVRIGRVERYANFNPGQRREHGRWAKTGGGHDAFRKSLSALREVRGSDQAKAAVGPFLNKPLRNADSGITATISADSLDEMTHWSKVKRSEDAIAHHAAVANLDHLFPYALHRESRPGKKPGDDIDIQAIHHFEVPMPFNGDVWSAHITVKAFKQKGQGNRIYLVRALQIRKPASLEESPESAMPQPVQTSPAGFQKRFAQLVDVVKQHLAGSMKSETERDAYSRCVESLARELYVAQRGMFEESKHPRDDAGKFADAAYDAHVARRKERGLSPLNRKQFDGQQALQKGVEASGGVVEESVKQHVGYKAASPTRPKPEAVAGQQQGLFDRGEFTTGQKSLFNVIAPGKPKSKSGKTADLFAGMTADVAAFLKDKETLSPADRGIIVQAESLPGQREMFQRAGAVMRYHATAVPSRPAWLKPKSATPEPEQQQPSKLKPAKPAKGGWQKVGGSSVFVNSAGRITKGCPGLKGHHVHELVDESDESRDHRAAKQAHAESRGLTGHDLTATAANKLGSKAMVSQHQSAKTAAKRIGVPMKDVLGSMSDAATVDSHHVGRMDELKARARQLTGMNAGTLAKIENAYRDHSTVPHFDETVASLQEEFADVSFGDDPADFVWQAMRQGKATKLSHDDIASEAANMVSASRHQRTSAMIGRMSQDVSKKMAAAVADDSFSFGANAAF